MFEIKTGDSTVAEASAEFRAQGYGLFRLVPGGPFLVPLAPDDPMDSYELNLFAAKPDRVADLACGQWLIEMVPAWSPDDAARTGALDVLKAQAFGPAFAPLCERQISRAYRDSLAAYAAWRSPSLSLPLRYAALSFSYRELRQLCQTDPGAGRLSTLARVAWEMGERGACNAALNTLLKMCQGGGMSLTEPCWPANPRFDAIDPESNIGQWFFVAALEQAERASSYSSYYVQNRQTLDWLCQQPFVSAEMERRRFLVECRTGNPIAVPARLRGATADHLNANLWRAAIAQLS
jgi:hypothetical protein